MIELHAIIRGYVQGVFFRATVCKHAESLGLVGSVRNMPDGSVELYAQGSKLQLESLLQKVKEQPGRGRIDAIQMAYSKPMRQFNSFEVIS